MHRDRNEAKGRVKTFTRRKAETGWRKRRENEKRRMHWQRSFATPVTRCRIYSYTAAAPTPTARSLRVSSVDEGRPRQRVSEKREKREARRAEGRNRQAWQQWPLVRSTFSGLRVFRSAPLSFSHFTVNLAEFKRTQ